MALSFLQCILFPLILTIAASYDLHPRMSESSGWPNVEMPLITERDVEEAFKEAKISLAERLELEKKLVAEGRIVNRRLRTAESSHQMAASSPPAVSNMEERQRKFEEVTHFLTRKYNLTPSQVEFGLPQLPLSGEEAESARQSCISQQTIRCNSSSPFRTQDGSCNNLRNVTWGMALSCFDRMPVPRAYSANSGLRVATGGGPLPNPRTLSLNIHSNVNRPTDCLTHMYMFFGQLLDHDITFTPQSTTVNNEAIECCPRTANSHPQCAPIEISANDPFYSQFGVRCLNFVRSAICPFCTAGVREQLNQVTTFVDASFLYGNSENVTASLRTLDGTGRLRMQPGDLLPASQNPNNDQCSLPQQNQICFRSGDDRVNQHPTLTALHTMFHREHNRIVGVLAQLNRGWGEERLFQEARRIVGAEMQAITYKEFLPMTLGSERMSFFGLCLSGNGSCSTYNPSTNPTLYNEFSTAAFRYGHTMINTLVDENPRRPNHSGHNLRDVFFYPFGLYQGETSPLLLGASTSPAQQFDRWMVPDVTNFLYRVRGNNTGLDLAAFNIQRGRDHGIAGYTSYVYFCSKKEINVRSFNDLVGYQLMTNETANVLRNNYRVVEDIDLFTGIISEVSREGAVIGPTATCIIGLQFQRLKWGDRFYFEHCNQAGSFTSRQMNELRSITLSRIMCDNTDITQMQPQAMLCANRNNPLTSCNNLPAMDLNAWKQ